MNFLKKSKGFRSVYDNSIDAYIPELWANESLLILQETMVIGNLVHRGFEPVIAAYGDIVNTRKPGEFEAVRKNVTDDVTTQNVSATNVQVPLDQLVHVSFLIRDGEESKSFKDLVTTYMAPAMLAQARFIDKILLGQVHRFTANSYGQLGGLTSSNGMDYLAGTRNIMNINKAWMSNRNLILTPNSETNFIKNDKFTDAQRIGDMGQAVREAALGRLVGFDLYMSQNTSSVATGNTATAGAINNASGYNIGDSVLTVDTFSGAVITGSWITIAGSMLPYRVTAHTETLGATTSITISPTLRDAVVDNAVVTAYTPGQVNNGAGYDAGYAKDITVDTFTVSPQVGQLVSFNTGTAKYSIIKASTTSITLDRPLDAAIADNDKVEIGPKGEYNFAFHRNALALVVRPLAATPPGVGARSSVISDGGLSIRATLSYDSVKQGMRVTLDMLCGIAILDVNLGAVMFG